VHSSYLLVFHSEGLHSFSISLHCFDTKILMKGSHCDLLISHSKTLHCFELCFVRIQRRRKAPYADLVCIYFFLFPHHPSGLGQLGVQGPKKRHQNIHKLETRLGCCSPMYIINKGQEASRPSFLTYIYIYVISKICPDHGPRQPSAGPGGCGRRAGRGRAGPALGQAAFICPLMGGSVSGAKTRTWRTCFWR